MTREGIVNSVTLSPLGPPGRAIPQVTRTTAHPVDVRCSTDSPIVRNLDVPGAAINDGRPTRFRKDILRVGTWYPRGKKWVVTHDTLDRIAGNFRRARDNGNRIPLVWDHDNSAQANAGEVVDCGIEGDTLYATVHAQDPKAKQRLGSVNNDVSVQVVEPWVDGKGNQYDLFLTHVAVVNHPVMPDQGQFTQFSKGPEPMARTITMANGDEAMVEKSGAGEAAESDGEGGGSDDTMMPVADVIAILEGALNVKFPAEVDTKKELKIALDAMLGGGQSAEGAADVTAPTAPDAMAGMDVQQLSLPATRQALKSAQSQLAAVIRQQREAAESVYRQRLESLVNSGRVAARLMGGLVDAGQAAQWSMAILAPFDDDSPQMPTGQPKSRSLATGTVPGDNSANVKAHQNRIRRKLGLAPEE